METLLAFVELKEILSTRRNDFNIRKKLDEFEFLVKQTKSIDDNEYCLRLYNKKNLTLAYKSLKYRLEEKLMNDIMSLASFEENLKSRVNANMVIGKLFYIASILQKNNYRRQAILMYEKCFNLADKFHYFSYALQCGEALANHYGFIAVDKKKMDYYIKRNNEIIAIIEAENFVRESNTLFSHLYVTKKGHIDKESIHSLKIRIEKMQTLKKTYKTYFIISYTNDLSFFYFQTIKDFSKALDTALLMLEEMYDKNDKFLLFQCYNNIGIAHFLLRNFEASQEWFQKAKFLPSTNSLYWFNVTSQLFLNFVQLQNFSQLYKLSSEVLTNKSLHKYPYFSEQWRIREAFVHFLIRAEIIELNADEKKQVKSFSISKFLNNVPFHSKDKSGQNITILVIQLLFLLADKKYDLIIDKIDALNQYTYRYLKNDDSFRSNCFIKMQIKMAEAGFHPIRTQSHTADLLKKLQKSNLVVDEKSPEVEIIPYDYLWDVVLDILKKNKM